MCCVKKIFLNINKSSLCTYCLQISDCKERYRESTFHQLSVGEFYNLCPNLNKK